MPGGSRPGKLNGKQCNDCSKKPAPGKKRCKSCGAKHAARERLRREQRRSAHACVKCGKPVATSKTHVGFGGASRVDEPAVYCRKCLRYFAERVSS